MYAVSGITFIMYAVSGITFIMYAVSGIPFIMYAVSGITFIMCDVSGIPFIMYAQSQKIGKPNNFKIFWSKKTKGSKQDSQNLLRSSMSERGEP
jgi:hypothetical protein